VWADLERIETHVEWMADPVQVEPRGGTRPGVGTFTCVTGLARSGTVTCFVVTERDRSGG
jgi:hypothetical protein